MSRADSRATDNFLWHTSSYSLNTEGNCIEAGLPQDTATLRCALRDSKNRAAGYFTLPTREWNAFLYAVRAHEYDS